MATKKEKMVTVSLYLGNDVLSFVDEVTPTGILGTTRNDVIVHMMRQFVFESWLTTRKALSRQAAIKAPAKKAPARKKPIVAKRTRKGWKAK